MSIVTLTVAPLPPFALFPALSRASILISNWMPWLLSLGVMESTISVRRSARLSSLNAVQTST